MFGGVFCGCCFAVGGGWACGVFCVFAVCFDLLLCFLKQKRPAVLNPFRAKYRHGISNTFVQIIIDQDIVVLPGMFHLIDGMFETIGQVRDLRALLNPLYQHLKKEAPGALGTRGIKWNFTKFLVNREGEVLKRFAPATTPAQLEAEIEALL